MQFTPPTSRESIGALLLAAVAALLFCGEAILPTRMLAPFPPEVLQPQRGEALGLNAVSMDQLLQGNPQMGDKFTLSLAWERILQSRLAAGEIPLWTRDLGGGTPVAPLMGQVYQPWNLLLYVLPATGVYGFWYWAHLILFGFFAYRFLRRLHASHVAGLFGMVVLVLGFWSQARVHHNVILTAALPAFAILSCVHHLVVYRGGLGHIAMLAVGTALSWLGGFAPVSLQVSYVAVAFALFLAIGQPRGSRLLPLCAVAMGMMLGVLMAAAQILPVLFAAAETSRPLADLALLSRFSLEWDHLLTLFWPTLFEWPSPEFYGAPDAMHPSWASLALLEGQLRGAGFNFPETAFYIGVVPLVLAIGGLAAAGSDRATRFFTVGGALGLAIALGVPGVLHAVTLLPGTMAGDIKRFLFLFALCVPVLVARGVDAMREAGTRWPTLALLGLGATSLFVAALHLVSPESLLEIYDGTVEATQQQPRGTMKEWVAKYPSECAVNRRRLLTCFVHAAAVAGVAAFLLRRFGARPFVIASLIGVTMVDLLVAGWGTRVAVATTRVETPPRILQPVLEATAQAEQDEAPRPRLFRLLAPDDRQWMDVPVFPNLGAFWGVEDLSMYCSLPKARMDEFFTAIEPTASNKIDVAIGGSGIYSLRDQSSLQHPLLDLIGVTWLLTDQALDLPGFVDGTPSGLPDSYRLYRRDGVLPRATFVTEVEVIPDRATRLRRLADPTRDPARVVILEDADAPMPSGRATARVEVIRHADEVVVIEVDTDADGYLRLADPYDAGWTARVDRTSVPVRIADHYLRAVYVPAGQHRVEFSYDGPRVVWPLRLSFFGWILCVGLVVAGARVRTLR